ncbi:glycosyltransferase [Microbacterium sp. zg.Y625]|uniref:glycosyltransferase family 2 protein n=1 Tax=Microbacterium jiangjiandongii TaxID=3049071 RepID=UPI00214B61F9|nr:MULTISPECIES: glycosyltransferase [unclassified Microbacterium]MCR2793526.1 glycosyltransferase [Microbacterium sp. zg.Y625]WIM25880.1 glycosyltransferase [Microbacterium sp. zg-Y625]
MRVAAVIPTIGRPELVRAVRSALDQSVPVWPVVVLDRPWLQREVNEQLRDLPHELVLTTGAVGGASARNLGVRSARADVIGFLDDDDEWLPDKTFQQLELLKKSPRAIATSRARLIGRKERIVPERPYVSGQPIADYLLDRSSITLRKNFMQSSTLLIPRQTAINVPWRDELPRHQDWTLLIDLVAQRMEVMTHPDPLVNVYQGSTASVSRSKDWRASEAWLNTFGAKASPKSRADFLCSVVVRSAIAAGDYRQALHILKRAIALRPHLSALLVAVSEVARRG